MNNFSIHKSILKLPSKKQIKMKRPLCTNFFKLSLLGMFSVSIISCSGGNSSITVQKEVLIPFLQHLKNNDTVSIKREMVVYRASDFYYRNLNLANKLLNTCDCKIERSITVREKSDLVDSNDEYKTLVYSVNIYGNGDTLNQNLLGNIEIVILKKAPTKVFSFSVLPKGSTVL